MPPKREYGRSSSGAMRRSVDSTTCKVLAMISGDAGYAVFAPSPSVPSHSQIPPHSGLCNCPWQLAHAAGSRSVGVEPEKSITPAIQRSCSGFRNSTNSWPGDAGSVDHENTKRPSAPQEMTRGYAPEMNSLKRASERYTKATWRLCRTGSAATKSSTLEICWSRRLLSRLWRVISAGSASATARVMRTVVACTAPSAAVTVTVMTVVSPAARAT